MSPWPTLMILTFPGRGDTSSCQGMWGSKGALLRTHRDRKGKGKRTKYLFPACVTYFLQLDPPPNDAIIQWIHKGIHPSISPDPLRPFVSQYPCQLM